MSSECNSGKFGIFVRASSIVNRGAAGRSDTQTSEAFEKLSDPLDSFPLLENSMIQRCKRSLLSIRSSLSLPSLCLRCVFLICQTGEFAFATHPLDIERIS
jgi:hypothetical protein